MRETKTRREPLERFLPGRVSEFLGLQRNVVALLAAMIVIGSGEELWMRFVPKYLEILGAGVLAIGTYDALKTVLGAVYAYPGGILADRWGHRRALVFFTATSIAGYAIVLALPRWEFVLAASFLFLGWTCFSLPATFSLVGKNLGRHKYGMGIAVQAIIKRVPILIGPIVGGWMLDMMGFHEGMRIALVASIVFGLVAIGIQSRIRESTPPARGEAPAGVRLHSTFREFSPSLRHLLLSDILVRFCERIPFAWVVIHAMSQPGVGAKEFGYLTGVEMATAMICFIPVAWVSDRFGREPFVVMTFVFFTLFPVALLTGQSFSWLALAFVIRGLKEFGEPARKALIIRYSEGPRQGRIVGAYYLARDLTVAPGAFLGAWLWELGPRANFWGAFLFGLSGTAYYLATLRRARR